MFVFPGDEKNQRHAGANRGVGDVESREPNFIAAALLQVKADKIHDFVSYQAVGKVSSDAAKNQPKGDLADQRMRVKMMSREKQRDEREEHDDNKGAVVAAENVPRCAGVSPMNEFEEAINDDSFVVWWQRAQHQPFGQLVEGEDGQCDDGNATV